MFFFYGMINQILNLSSCHIVDTAVQLLKNKGCIVELSLVDVDHRSLSVDESKID